MLHPLRPERSGGRVSLLLWLLLIPFSLPAAGAPLPEPLTLEFALGLADEAHPQVMAFEAGARVLQAEREAIDADTALSLTVEGRLRWVDPSPVATNQQSDDHRLALIARKRLYDFGSSAALLAASDSQLEAIRLQREALLQRRRLEIMSAYYAVLLADLTFARDNEAMAISYVTLERLRTSHELGQVSDIELLEQERSYQGDRARRAASESRQRASRATLAQLLNRPDALSSALEPPPLAQLEKKTLPYEPLLQRVMEGNLALQGLRQELLAAQQRVEAARRGGGATISAEVEGAEYSRELGGSDRLRAGLYLNFPLLDGGRSRAAESKMQAELYRVQARLREKEFALREATLTLWLKLQNLLLEREQRVAELDYRELYLDRSRANYEMEVMADLGDAMVRLSEAQLSAARTDFSYALAWSELEQLAGGLAIEEGSER